MIDSKELNLQGANKELSPAEVASILNIAYSKARRLMESNEIRSWIDTRATDGRRFLKTILREVYAYHERKLETRAREFEKQQKPHRRIIKSQSKVGLSTKSIDEFFRTEILNG